MAPMRYASALLLILGCGGSSGSMAVPDGAAPTLDSASADAIGTATDGPTPSDASSPVPGARVTQPSFAGQGACAGKTLGQLIAAVHQQMPGLADITAIDGMDAGLGGDGNRIYAFAHDDGFRLIFKRGSGDCPSGCIDNEYWYFATDAACAPVLAGHHARIFDSSGNCYKVEGRRCGDGRRPSIRSTCAAPTTARRTSPGPTS
jgi:hypothetical protein